MRLEDRKTLLRNMISVYFVIEYRVEEVDAGNNSASFSFFTVFSYKFIDNLANSFHIAHSRAAFH